ncbi:MAG: heme exporter protein CcmB [Gammaproteobacteria bacterium RIFCSPHIGHO2_12_FULL_45_12]|nr:MAG: heme exporter protein CcmB [Gammaproteobacteria bacterium RIFCSPHIGHO2_12_FULL_45_12]
MLAAFRYVLYTELLLLLRRSQEWLHPLSFFIIVICLFPLAFTPDTRFLQTYMPGCIWIAALLASLLSVETMFYTDMEDGHLEQLTLSQLPLTAIMLAKLAAQWLITQLPLVLLTPVLGLLFHLPFTVTLALGLSLLLGTPLLSLLGCLGVTLTLGLKQQGVLLSLLILPLATPVLIFGVSIVQQAQAGLNMAGPLAFLAGLSVFAMTLLPIAIASMVKVSLDD